MNSQFFVIKSLLIQNIIMGLILAILLGVLFWGLKIHSRKFILAAGVWTIIIFWFFNSSFWGFSAVTVNSQGLRLHYGFLSILKNTSLPVDTSWKVKIYMGGVKKMRTLYFLKLADHQSIKVRSRENLRTLEDIGSAINRINGRSMGSVETHPYSNKN